MGNEQGPETDNVPAPQPPQLATWTVIGAAIVVILALFGVQTEHQPDSSRAYPSRPQIPDAQATLMPAPEVDDEYLPCADCHEGEKPNREVRELEDEHEENIVEHGNLWCFHCHDENNPNSLHLADDAAVDFEESWKLCTQCHAKKLPDWRAGVHGKRTGHWRGTKEYRTCVVCHEPHRPAFPSMAPESRPPRPEEISLHPAPPSDPVEQSH